MKIASNDRMNHSLSFGKALSTKQEKEQVALIKEVKEALGQNGGISVGKVYTASAPSDSKTDDGVGKINSIECSRLAEIMKVYAGATAIKSFPAGQLEYKQGYNESQYCGAYQRSAMTLGEDNINLANLTKPEYASILPEKDFKAFLSQAQKTKRDGKINFDAELGFKQSDEYPINKPLKIAYNNLMNSDSPKAKKLREEFDAYKNQTEPVNVSEYNTRLALFPVLFKEKEPGVNVDFFKGFDKDPNVRAQKQEKYDELKEKYADAIDFFSFKQFLAEKEVAAGKEKMNKDGLDLFGDCPIGFSWPEEKVFADAFLDRADGNGKSTLGWGLPVLDVKSLTSKNDSPAHKLLHDKVAMNLNRFDGIRFDVGWSYMNPLYTDNDHYFTHLGYTDKIVNFIEKTAEEVKGPNFDKRKLIYEADANGDDFNLWEGKRIADRTHGLLVLSTVNEHNEGQGWGNTSFLKDNLRYGEDQMIVGTNNHDTESIIECAETPFKRDSAVGALMKVFHLRNEDGVRDGWKNFKDNNSWNDNNRKFTMGKFAEIFNVKNNFTFFTDVLGRREKLDSHAKNKASMPDEYRFRLEKDYEKHYHEAVQDGVGLNLMKTYEFILKSRGFDQNSPLVKKVKAFGDYLAMKSNVCTRAQADAEEKRVGYKAIK